MISDAHLDALQAHALLVEDLQKDIQTKNQLARIFRTLVEEPLVLRRYAPVCADTCAVSSAALSILGDVRPKTHREHVAAGLHYEHPVPLTSVLYPMLRDAFPNKNAARQILTECLRPTWITKIENDRLNAAGLSRRMPEGWVRADGPFARYDAVGVRVTT